MIERQVPASIEKLCGVFCGCGNPGAVWQVILDELARCEGGTGKKWPETGHEYLAAYVVDYAGMTEHGGSVGGAWLTPEGEEALKFLREWGADWSESKTVSFVASDGSVCGGAMLHG